MFNESHVAPRTAWETQNKAQQDCAERMRERFEHTHFLKGSESELIDILNKQDMQRANAFAQLHHCPELPEYLNLTKSETAARLDYIHTLTPEFSASLREHHALDIHINNTTIPFTKLNTITCAHDKNFWTPERFNHIKENYPDQQGYLLIPCYASGRYIIDKSLTFIYHRSEPNFNTNQIITDIIVCIGDPITNKKWDPIPIISYTVEQTLKLFSENDDYTYHMHNAGKYMWSDLHLKKEKGWTNADIEFLMQFCSDVLTNRFRDYNMPPEIIEKSDSQYTYAVMNMLIRLFNEAVVRTNLALMQKSRFKKQTVQHTVTPETAISTSQAKPAPEFITYTVSDDIQITASEKPESPIAKIKNLNYVTPEWNRRAYSYVTKTGNIVYVPETTCHRKLIAENENIEHHDTTVIINVKSNGNVKKS